MQILVSDRSYKNSIRWYGEGQFSANALFFYKGEEYALARLPQSNVIYACTTDEYAGEVLEISFHNADRMLHMIQVRPAYPDPTDVLDEEFAWAAVYALLRAVGYVGLKNEGVDDEYDYRLLIALQEFHEEVTV